MTPKHPMSRLLPFALCLAIVGPWLAPGTPTAVAQQDQKFELGDEGFEKIEAPDPSTPEGKIWLIRKALAEDDPDEAEDLADDWIKQYPNHPLGAQAYLLRGDAKSAQDNYFKALYDYEHVIRVYPGSPQFDTALAREMRIAQMYSRGVRRKLWGIRFIAAYGEAEELFIRIQERSPGSQLAEEAGIELGDHYYRQSDMPMAADAYDLFLANYPRSQWREYAMNRQIMSNLATFKGPRFDATGLIEAQRRLVDYRQQFPAAAEQMGAEALSTRIDESLAQRSLISAEWYLGQGNKVSAVFMYKRTISDYPRTASAREALAKLRELDPDLFAQLEPSVKLEPTPHVESERDGEVVVPDDEAVPEGQEPAPQPLEPPGPDISPGEGGVEPGAAEPGEVDQ